MNDYEDGLHLDETEQAEYDAWQQEVEAYQALQEMRATMWAQSQDEFRA